MCLCASVRLCTCIHVCIGLCKHTCIHMNFFTGVKFPLAHWSITTKSASGPVAYPNKLWKMSDLFSAHTTERKKDTSIFMSHLSLVYLFQVPSVSSLSLSLFHSPWYKCIGWLGIKHHVTYSLLLILLVYLCSRTSKVCDSLVPRTNGKCLGTSSPVHYPYMYMNYNTNMLTV